MKSGIPKKQRLADERRRKAAKPAGAWDTASKSPPSAIPYRRGRNGHVARAVGLVDHEEAHQRPAGP